MNEGFSRMFFAVDQLEEALALFLRSKVSRAESPHASTKSRYAVNIKRHRKLEAAKLHLGDFAAASIYY